MEQTNHLKLPYILPSQAQKHVTHNEALRILDAIVQLAVIARDYTHPDPAAEEGDRYIVPDDAGGDWALQTQKIAAFTDGSWYYFTPQTGWLCYVKNESNMLVFNGNDWQELTGSSDISSVEMLGIHASADETNRLTVSSEATLFNHAGNGHQLKLNKNTDADTASLLFQSNWTGHAEMGLAGSKDFSVKVGDDNGQWREAMRIDRTSGNVMIGAMFPSTRLHVDGPIRTGTTTVANLPSATTHGAGSIIFVSDATGGAQHAYSDGSQWLSLRSGTVIA
ncbi:DUF2793 domain-containing protein [Paenochrobactrum pullorum]|uniref:DUF2793 domain-containing protein n=1 Tax=Paenochrobactrum pullorum TaxID=1324351 RepID=UPI0035BC2767